ncbi:hypothetical protein B0J13DRAFT_41578 [Dactylonectria estremocensis]|uniref:Uncharacterized protein n=1 Tax=Dactylonectria estremocensis TaxID=1079267 RepID=A0A9P9J6A9_9HYPO|nr:hypothetical protein B0J13DRAFT_41578 [Dactylonectria estremocensis]
MVSYCEYLQSRIDLIGEPVNEPRPDTTKGLQFKGQLNSDHEQPTRENDYIAALDQRREEAKIQARRIACYMKNTRLRDLAMPIEPLPIYHPFYGIIEPDMSLYPRNVKEFYALRTPESVHQRQVLAYLTELYNIPRHNWSMGTRQVSGTSRHVNETPHDRYHAINVFTLNETECYPTTVTQEHTSTVEDVQFYNPGRAVQYLEALLGLSEDHFSWP